MPWFRVDDQLHTHPKGDNAGDAALGLWVRAGSYCMAYKTNGHVPTYWVKRQAQGMKKAAALVTAGLWEAVSDGFLFHDWEDIQETAEQIEAKREKARKRTKEWRDRMAGVEKGDGSPSDGVRDASRDASRDGAVTVPYSSTSSTTSSHGSSGRVIEGGGTSVTRERPPRHCPKHPNGTTDPCGACKDARIAHDEWKPPIPTIKTCTTALNGDKHPTYTARVCPICRADMLAGDRPWDAWLAGEASA